MKKQIKKLVKKTYLYDNYETVADRQQKIYSFTEEGLEKFAELLFNEIANTAVVSDGMFNGDERRLYVELRLGDMVKKISVLGFEE